MVKRGLISGLISAIFLISGAAWAGPKGECRGDIEKFCAPNGAGGGKIGHCLQEHQSELSPACQTAIQKRKSEFEKRVVVCKEDREKFCAGVQPGEGRLMACFKDHQAELGKDCAKTVAKVEKHRERRLACKGDREKFCKDVQPGEGRIRACMKAHESEWSEACRQVSQGKTGVWNALHSLPI